MIPPHLFYQLYPSLFEQNNCTPLKCNKQLCLEIMPRWRIFRQDVCMGHIWEGPALGGAGPNWEQFRSDQDPSL